MYSFCLWISTNFYQDKRVKTDSVCPCNLDLRTCCPDQTEFLVCFGFYYFPLRTAVPSIIGKSRNSNWRSWHPDALTPCAPFRPEESEDLELAGSGRHCGETEPNHPLIMTYDNVRQCPPGPLYGPLLDPTGGISSSQMVK